MHVTSSQTNNRSSRPRHPSLQRSACVCVGLVRVVQSVVSLLLTGGASRHWSPTDLGVQNLPQVRIISASVRA